MAKITRRTVIAAGASAGLALSAPHWVRSSAAATRTRYSATSAMGKAMLKLYAQAVDTMMNKIPKGDPRNWDFQWYTHWIPGPQGPWSAVKAHKTQTINDVYKGKPANDPHRLLAQQMWDDCQAHGDNTDDPTYFQELFFLPWHRYFVYYFEDIIRGVLQSDTFTLPYWSYLGSGPSAAIIPPEFRASKSPLYQAKRYKVVNDGKPIQTSPGGIPINGDAFKETVYYKVVTVNGQPTEVGFCPILDNGIHGAVHVDVGSTKNMGHIPTAANDPVFWLHHCNIDRLWESWNRLPGRLNPKWPNRNFVFANALGGAVSAPVAGADRVALLGYDYDDYYVPPGVSTAPVLAARPFSAATAPTESMAKVTQAIGLGNAPVRAALTPPAPPVGIAPRAAPLLAASAGRTAYLILSGIMLHADPGEVVYDVYLNLPEGAKATPSDPGYVGTLGFFNIMVGDGQMGANHSSASFNVTDVLAKLQRADRLSPQPSVTLLPRGEMAAAAQATVEHIDLVQS